ncbi:hypothetical protein Btru_015320 [Bulinus truncatus]|nr:hypothetical protein Btru_015320 [Bulinus truncatus]
MYITDDVSRRLPTWIVFVLLVREGLRSYLLEHHKQDVMNILEDDNDEDYHSINVKQILSSFTVCVNQTLCTNESCGGNSFIPLEDAGPSKCRNYQANKNSGAGAAFVNGDNFDLCGSVPEDDLVTHL